MQCCFRDKSSIDCWPSPRLMNWQEKKSILSFAICSGQSFSILQNFHSQVETSSQRIVVLFSFCKSDHNEHGKSSQTRKKNSNQTKRSKKIQRRPKRRMRKDKRTQEEQKTNKIMTKTTAKTVRQKTIRIMVANETRLSFVSCLLLFVCRPS